LVLLALAALALGGMIGAGVRMLARPAVATVASTPADGTRAQQKIFEVARRRPQDADAPPVTLTEAEVNALLTRHLVEARGLGLTITSARLLGDDRVEMTGEAPLERLLAEISLGAVGRALPAKWRARPVGLRARLLVSAETAPRRQLRLDVETFQLGRQRLPAPALRLLLDPATLGLLRWPLPASVRRVTVEPGRVIIRTGA
jgi:hypothetical protein